VPTPDSLSHSLLSLHYTTWNGSELCDIFDLTKNKIQAQEEEGEKCMKEKGMKGCI
jgi:hypothetical protein